ncbi:hypothetical protein BS50DRAFT_573576 [Corynespora cassiicola Philippines]|uniref:Core domain-containing protein n=1 Tax=Corynespora cassiicola Philippines TaxID=1448308 RepID=A0A2T2NNW8_CORCC|nr:hypothetical protein BS50DRAFT_573576 [Corynespora cassiicola Philippines]
MASASSMCTACFRAAHRSAIRSAAKPPNPLRQSARAYRIASATPQPLYLDFLAPTPRRIPSAQLARGSVTSPWQTRRALATAAEPMPARAIHNPRTTDDGQPMLVSLSPRAASRLSNISASDKNPDLALRITVESGGCHGFQYLMDLTDLSKSPPTEEDTVFEGDKGAKVVIDEASLELLNGSTVDYTMELIGSQFKVTGIPGATSSCGCGTSFDIKL